MRPKIVLITMIAAVGVLSLLVALKGFLAPRDVAPQESTATTDGTPAAGDSTTTKPAPAKPIRIAKPSPDDTETTVTAPAVVPTNTPPNASPANNQTATPITSVVATTPTEDRQAAIHKDLSQIREALLVGASNPNAITTVRDRLQSSEPEVRKAATIAAMHLNDRGAIPILKVALEQVNDTREKVTILDAIEYLQIPESSETLPKANESTTAQNPQMTNDAQLLDLPRN